MSNNINRYRIIPPSAGRNPNNQFYQKEQQKQPEQSGATTESFDKSSFDAPQTKVPQRGTIVDIFSDVPVGANSYQVAEWERTSA